MRQTASGFLAVLLCAALVVLPVQSAPRIEPELAPVVRSDLEQALSLSYVELFDKAAGFEFRTRHLEILREELTDREKACVKALKRRAKTLSSRLDEAQAELRRGTGKLSEAERRELHCRIQNRRIEERQARMLAEHAVPVAYDNKQAKLDLIERWPAEQRRIRAEIAAGTHTARTASEKADSWKDMHAHVRVHAVG